MDEKEQKTASLRTMRDEIVNLTSSPFYNYRVENKYFPVIGQGNHNASIMFIGEAPGKNEAQSGIPFCGAAGKILDELLASIDLPREEVYITNIVKDRPPQNRDPLPGEIALYAPFLDRQIEIIEPKVIATLGRFSMDYVMRRYGLGESVEPISQLHGKMFTTTGPGENTLIITPLFHPAVAIYDRSKKDALLADFAILKQFI